MRRAPMLGGGGYDPINGDTGALFPPNRLGRVPPMTGDPMPMGATMPGMGAQPPQSPLDDTNPDVRQRIIAALQSRLGGPAGPVTG